MKQSSDNLNSERLQSTEDIASTYGDKSPSVPIKGKTQTGFMKRRQDPSQEKTDKLICVNTAMQKRFSTLKRTSKSRFDGVNKYYHGAFLSK